MNTNQACNFLGMLTILFIGLKLTHFINWSWWLVFLPLYGGLVVCVIIVGLAIWITALYGIWWMIKRIFSQI
jgi:hypothetical protein